MMKGRASRAAKPCFEVEGLRDAEVVPVLCNKVSDEEVVLVFLGDGVVFKLLSEIRCLRSITSGMASTRLV